MAAPWLSYLQAIRAGGAVYDCAVRHVADGDQYRDGRAFDQHGVFECWARAQAFAAENPAQDHDPGDAALYVYRLSVESRHGVVGNRRGGDADRFAGARRLSLAGIQQP